MSRNIRDYARQTTTRLIIGGFLILFIIGDGLIFLIYGAEAALSGLICLGIAVAPIAFILLFFFIVDAVIAASNRE